MSSRKFPKPRTDSGPSSGAPAWQDVAMEGTARARRPLGKASEFVSL